ncbi:hypothetical protein ACU686_20915 [Yinghuangia aomiensis]
MDRFSFSEAGRLQTFPANYPWAGRDVGQQIGNAVPPRLAMHVLSAAFGWDPPSEELLGTLNTWNRPVRPPNAVRCPLRDEHGSTARQRIDELPRPRAAMGVGAANLLSCNLSSQRGSDVEGGASAGLLRVGDVFRYASSKDAAPVDVDRFRNFWHATDTPGRAAASARCRPSTDSIGSTSPHDAQARTGRPRRSDQLRSPIASSARVRHTTPMSWPSPEP